MKLRKCSKYSKERKKKKKRKRKEHLLKKWLMFIIFTWGKIFTPVLTGSFFFTGVWVTASLLRSPGLLNILADFNGCVIWMVLILSLITSSPNLFSRPLETVLRAPTTTVIPITMFHNFFSSLAKWKYLSVIFFSFLFFFFCSLLEW